jgi:hypothetical protein
MPSNNCNSLRWLCHPASIYQSDRLRKLHQIPMDSQRIGHSLGVSRMYQYLMSNIASSVLLISGLCSDNNPASRTLQEASFTNSAMTPLLCTQFCSETNGTPPYNFAATEYSQECCMLNISCDIFLAHKHFVSVYQTVISIFRVVLKSLMTRHALSLVAAMPTKRVVGLQKLAFTRT